VGKRLVRVLGLFPVSGVFLSEEWVFICSLRDQGT
jgi:hypothetical protein